MLGGVVLRPRWFKANPGSERDERVCLSSPFQFLEAAAALTIMAAVAPTSKSDILFASTSARQAEAAPLRTLRREQLAQLVCQGHVLVLHRRTVYRLNAWLALHPGGALAILHFVGRDATDELEAYHPAATIKRMRAFAIGEVDERDWSDDIGWKPLVPPVQLGWPERAEAYAGVPSISHALDQLKTTPSHSLHLPLLSPVALEPAPPPEAIAPARQHSLSLAYRQLHDDIIAAKLYEPMPVWRYRFELVRYTLIFLAFAVTFARATRPCARQAIPTPCEVVLSLGAQGITSFPPRCSAPSGTRSPLPPTTSGIRA
jgi:hypothetical protein